MPDSSRKASKQGWTTVAFGDVVRQVKDRIDPEDSGLDRYVAGEHMDTDDLRIRRWGLVGDGYLGPAFHMRFKPGHVLYGSRRTYLRKVALADFEGITANTTYVLESSDPEVLLPELLPFIMQTEAFARHSVRESKGSVNPYVNFSDLAWFEFALPPIEEQRRMAHALIASEALMTAFRSLHDQSLAVFRAIGSALTDTRHSDSLWSFPSLGDIVQPERSLSYGILKPGIHDSSGVPMLRVENVDDVGLRTSDSVLYVSRAIEATKKSTRLRDGDVLVSVVASIGRVFRVTTEMHDWNISRAWAVISPRSEVDPDYLAVFLQSSYAQSFFRMRSTGSAQAVLNIAELKQLRVPLPSLPQQRRIAAAAERARRSAVAAKARMQMCQRLNRMFIGETTA